MKTEKMLIDLKGDTLRIGADFHTLEDKTRSTFKTNQVSQLVEFLKVYNSFRVFCAPGLVVAWPNDIDRYTEPLALCSLSESAALAGVKANLGRPIPLEKFTEFMETYKRFTNAAGLEFLANLRHFKMKKIVTVESKKEKNGDYSFKVDLESAGKGAGKEDFEPPALLVFEVPVFKFLSDQVDCIRLSCEVNFQVIQGETPALNFTLTNFAYDDELLARQVEIINRHLEPVSMPKLWGSQDVKQQTDSWRFQANPSKD